MCETSKLHRVNKRNTYLVVLRLQHFGFRAERFHDQTESLLVSMVDALVQQSELVLPAREELFSAIGRK